MHRIFARCAVVAMFACVSVAAQSTSYPDRPVRIIVPYGAGTGPDLIARILGEQLGPRINQSVVVENRPGAGGKIGTEAAATAEPDGYTLLLGGKDTHGILTHLYPSWRIKPQNDFEPIALLARIQNVILTTPDPVAANPQELIEVAKKKELRYGTPGVGTNLHLMAAYLQSHHDLKLVHIPYSKFPEAFPALARGEIELLVAGMPPSMSLVKDGRIKAVGVTGTQRSPFAPDIPTFAESGVKGLESGGWFGLFAPKGTPEPIIDMLAEQVAEISKLPAYGEKFANIYTEVAPSTPGELATLVADETRRWGEVVAESGIKVEQ